MYQDKKDRAGRKNKSVSERNFKREPEKKFSRDNRDEKKSDEKFSREPSDRKSFVRKERNPSFSEKSFVRKSFDKNSVARPARENNDRGFRSSKPERRERSSDKPFVRKSFDRTPNTRPNRDESKRGLKNSPPDRIEHSSEKPFERKSFDKKPFTRNESDRDKPPFRNSNSERGEGKWNRREKHEFFGEKKKFGRDNSERKYKEYKTPAPRVDDGFTRLNKFISNAGICSRREADSLIESGVISVNGKLITQLGFKIKDGDEVKFNNETLRTEKHVYLLLNKPKDFITTTDDPEDRKTVMWLIKDKCRERIYPVGRLDRNTTGVLLFTNDGELSRRLTHPSFGIEKVYQVELDKKLSQEDFDKIENGITLEDGPIKPDAIAFTTPDKMVLGIEIHSGRNKIVRRIFESLGYEVKKLDRVVFAGLTKKDLPRGRSRFLTELEVAHLKMATGKKKLNSDLAPAGDE